MAYDQLYSLEDMRRELGSYHRQLSVFLADERLEPVAVVGGRKLYNQETLETLRGAVHTWKNRRRLHGKTATTS